MICFCGWFCYFVLLFLKRALKHFGIHYFILFLKNAQRQWSFSAYVSPWRRNWFHVPTEKGVCTYGVCVCFLPYSKSLTSWAQKLKQNQPKRINAEESCVNSMQDNVQAKTLPLENVSLCYGVFLISFFLVVFFQCYSMFWFSMVFHA